jgi:catechol 2,3-dioxygenase-like lactoylglutathione lyase family enzyme
MSLPSFRLASTVLGAPDPRGLAAFYQELLGWERPEDEAEWVVLKPPGSSTGLSFQLEDSHVPPTWPAGPGDQQMQAHLDVAVTDLEAGVRRAESLGATLASYQPQDDVRVLFDPAGHPFCLFESAAPSGS